MDESDDWDMLSPIERRLFNNDLSSEINFSCVNDSNNHHHNFRGFEWDVGESSSRASLQDRVCSDGLKIGQLESSSSTIRHPHDSFIVGPSNTQGSVSNHVPMNVNLNIGYDGNSDDDDDDDDDNMGFMDFYKSGRSELQSSNLFSKRKPLEGTSEHPTGGGSSFFPQASRSLNTSPPLLNHVPIFRHESPNERASENSSHTHIGLRGSVPYNNISSTGNTPTRRPNISTWHSNQSSNRQILFNEFLDQTSRGPAIVPPVNPSSVLNQQPLSMHVPSIPRNAPQFPWSSNIRSRTGGRIHSSLLRNNVQYHNFVPPSDSRNLVQDPTNWSLSTGNSGAPSSSRNGTRPSNALWPPQRNPTMPSQREFPPWTLFPPAAELEPGGQRGHFPLFPVPVGSSSSTTEDNRMSAGVPSPRHHYLPFSRNGLMMEVPSEDWRALAADIEGRQRIVSEIRQVLNAMRRGENIGAEDYMLFDPFINGVAELHDRHRDMRLDVDNMSYEELLALEERIGNVNTGLSEEVILKSMKQRRHISFMAISTKNSEPCCICQENYSNGDNIGRLDCGHDFHTDCIKLWLTHKNICPICKTPGLAT